MSWIGIDVAKRSFTASKPGNEPARLFTMDLDGWHAFRERIHKATGESEERSISLP